MDEENDVDGETLYCICRSADSERFMMWVINLCCSSWGLMKKHVSVVEVLFSWDLSSFWVTNESWS